MPWWLRNILSLAREWDTHCRSLVSQWSPLEEQPPWSMQMNKASLFQLGFNMRWVKQDESIMLRRYYGWDCLQDQGKQNTTRVFQNVFNLHPRWISSDPFFAWNAIDILRSCDSGTNTSQRKLATDYSLRIAASFVKRCFRENCSREPTTTTCVTKREEDWRMLMRDLIDDWALHLFIVWQVVDDDL